MNAPNFSGTLPPSPRSHEEVSAEMDTAVYAEESHEEDSEDTHSRSMLKLSLSLSGGG